jgi:hypothetical protein
VYEEAMYWDIPTNSISGVSNSTTWNYNFTSLGNYTWNVKTCDNAGNCQFSANNYTLQLSDTIPPVTTLNTPLNNTYSNNTNQIFNASFTDTYSLSNSTLYIWDNSNNIINDIGSYTGFSFFPSANSNPRGITNDGTYFWITDSSGAEVYKYWMNGTYAGISFDTAGSGNYNPHGITNDGTYFWITDLSNEEVYKYWMNGTYAGISFDTAGSGNGFPIGITQNGTFFWITDFLDSLIYKYWMNGTYTGTNFSGGSNYITSDNTYIWTTDNVNHIFQFLKNGTSVNTINLPYYYFRRNYK